MGRITIHLSLEEREALYAAAIADLRGMREQARWLVRQGLEQHGYLTPIIQHDVDEPDQQTQKVKRG
jgi:hypothetical protein